MSFEFPRFIIPGKRFTSRRRSHFIHTLLLLYLECIITFTSHLHFFFLSFWSNQNKNLPDAFRSLPLSGSFISFISLFFPPLPGCDCSQQAACFVIVLPYFLTQSSSLLHFKWPEMKKSGGRRRVICKVAQEHVMFEGGKKKGSRERGRHLIWRFNYLWPFHL